MTCLGFLIAVLEWCGACAPQMLFYMLAPALPAILQQ